MAVPTPPLPPLPESDQSRPHPAGDGSALISKRSGTSSFSVAAVVRIAEANDKFASFSDAAAAAVVVGASSSLAAAAKPTETFLSAAAAATAVETTAIDADRNDKG